VKTDLRTVSLSPQIEIRLAEKEEQLLERDLVFEQATRLAERVRNKVDVGRDDSLSLAKKVRFRSFSPRQKARNAKINRTFTKT